jgi:hypothetical protein
VNAASSEKPLGEAGSAFFARIGRRVLRFEIIFVHEEQFLRETG